MIGYQPKHMVDKEAIIDRWQAQAAQAAAMSSSQKLNGIDGQVWTFLHIMAESRDVLKSLYDYGSPTEDTYEPQHLARPIVGNIRHTCPQCGGRAVITKRVCFGADPHNVYRCTECRWHGRNPGTGLS